MATMTNGNKNYEEAIEALINESKQTGEGLGVSIGNGLQGVDSLLGKAAEKAIDIVKDNLDDVADPDV